MVHDFLRSEKKNGRRKRRGNYKKTFIYLIQFYIFIIYFVTRLTYFKKTLYRPYTTRRFRDSTCSQKDSTNNIKGFFFLIFSRINKVFKLEKCFSKQENKGWEKDRGERAGEG